jgi:PAS domain S-box-containing protein
LVGFEGFSRSIAKIVQKPSKPTNVPDNKVNTMEDYVHQAVVDTMQDGLLMVDTTGRILAVNPAFEEMTGYSSGELVGKSCTVLNCTGCEIIAKGPAEQWCSLFAKGTIRRRKCEISAKSGHTVYVVKYATVLRDEMGEMTGAVETLMDISEMVHQEEEITSLKRTLYRQDGIFGIIGSSPQIQGLLDLIENVAQSDAPALIYGESGVGKELVARAIHEAGPRAKGSFIKVNCASLNENLLESELFGHVKGAFTGADRSRIGRFEAASGGSLFLDEIGDISASIQVKLLRVLESKEIERVGDHKPIPVDVRLITATNQNLEDLVARNIFREDLFYRIHVVPIYVPPLRERKEDIPLIAQTFIDKIAARCGKAINGLTPEAAEAMNHYHWPGNVREVLNAIEYAFVLCTDERIGPHHLPPRITSAEMSVHPSPSGPPSLKVGFADSTYYRQRERLVQALKQANGNRTEAARILGVSRVTVWKWMKKYGVT